MMAKNTSPPIHRTSERNIRKRRNDMRRIIVANGCDTCLPAEPQASGRKTGNWLLTTGNCPGNWQLATGNCLYTGTATFSMISFIT
jgi:hypothetical protein